MDNNLGIILIITEGNGLDTLVGNLPLDSEFFIKINKIRHDRFNKILSLLHIVRGDISQHEDSRLAFVCVIILQDIAGKDDLLLFQQLGNKSDLLV